MLYKIQADIVLIKNHLAIIPTCHLAFNVYAHNLTIFVLLPFVISVVSLRKLLHVYKDSRITKYVSPAVTP